MKTRIGLIGSGWRAEFFLRVAKALPHMFEITGVVTRNAEKAERFAREFGVRIFGTPEELLTDRPDYAVLSVSKAVCADIALYLANQNMPVLMETPPADNMEKLVALHRELPRNAVIQVAEQYHLQPMHAARLSYIKTGRLGPVVQAGVSFTQGYHAVSLMRRYLGLGFENAEITATSFSVPVIAGPTRAGEPQSEQLVEKSQTVAVFDFGGKVGIFDFESDQHRSWVRSQRIQIKGERGEIFNSDIKYLIDYKTPIETSFVRRHLGEDANMEGFDLKGIMADGAWHYRNPFQGSRLSDDEIAVASCMDLMARHVAGGPGFYSLAEASQDTYLAAMMDKTAEEGGRLRTETQIWAE